MIYNGKFKVTSPFGPRVLNGVPGDHKGIDVVGITDKYVCAVAAGVVAASTIITDKSDRTWEWGNYVRVDGDDGKRYYYCHLSKRLVTVGRRVKIGDYLGIEGNTGYSFGTHCHFEVRDRAGNSLNPAGFLGVPNEKGVYTVNKEEVKKDERTDSEPQDWSREAVEWAVANGIIFGDGTGNLMLREPCTREQVLVFLYRMYQAMQGG